MRAIVRTGPRSAVSLGPIGMTVMLLVYVLLVAAVVMALITTAAVAAVVYLARGAYRLATYRRNR